MQSAVVYEYIKKANDMRSHITTLMMESVSETSAYLNHVTRLSARENYTEFCRRENYKTYTFKLVTFFWKVKNWNCEYSLGNPTKSASTLCLNTIVQALLVTTEFIKIINKTDSLQHRQENITLWLFHERLTRIECCKETQISAHCACTISTSNCEQLVYTLRTVARGTLNRQDVSVFKFNSDTRVRKIAKRDN
jgi:hypothetical protein